ncbi:MAG: hypothetical protein QM650_02750 [Microlunatus sp.]
MSISHQEWPPLDVASEELAAAIVANELTAQQLRGDGIALVAGELAAAAKHWTDLLAAAADPDARPEDRETAAYAVRATVDSLRHPEQQPIQYRPGHLYQRPDEEIRP